MESATEIYRLYGKGEKEV